MIKFTKLEIDTIVDRPEDCIIQNLCDFYTDEMIQKYGDRNTTSETITEIWEGHERIVYPEQKTDYAINDLYVHLEDFKSLPEHLTELDKEILDNCISCGTWDRAFDVSPQYYGQVKRAVKSIADKFDKLGVKISWLSFI